MKFTLKKYSVLKKNKNFQYVYRGGKSYVSKNAVLYVLPNYLNICRIGFAAGKKLGNAVKRNRIKRLMREAYRLNQFNIKKGYDLVFVGRKPLINADLYFVISVFIELCKRAGIYVQDR